MQISKKRINELLHFLPSVDPPDPALRADWAGGTADGKGVMSFPYPVYPTLIAELYTVAGQRCWMDTNYTPSEAGELVASDEAVAAASMEQIKTMLTYCVRGERLCIGHWEAMIHEGRIGLILRRLKQLQC